MMLDAVEWRVLSYLSIMNIEREVTANTIRIALALREDILNEALQRLKDRELVSTIPGEDGVCYRIMDEGKRQLRR